jgi:hypothetical protein
MNRERQGRQKTRDEAVPLEDVDVALTYVLAARTALESDASKTAVLRALAKVIDVLTGERR